MMVNITKGENIGSEIYYLSKHDLPLLEVVISNN
jgi:hypothetical protein